MGWKIEEVSGFSGLFELTDYHRSAEYRRGVGYLYSHGPESNGGLEDHQQRQGRRTFYEPFYSCVP